MRITSIFMSNTNHTIKLALNTPDATDPFVVKSILGLDADEIAQRFFHKGSVDITQRLSLIPRQLADKKQSFYDFVLPKRDIVINVMMNPRYDTGVSYANLRDEMYKMITSSRLGILTLSFADESTYIAEVSGFVTKLEAPQFTQVQELTITMSCRDPMLRGRDYISPISETAMNLNNTTFSFNDNISTAPHGLKFEVVFNIPGTSTDTFRIWNVTEGWEFYIFYPTKFVFNDHLRFSSENDNKYLLLNDQPSDPNYVQRLSAYGIPLYSIADKIEPLSTGWPMMFPGKNTYNFDATYYHWKNLTYRTAFWGV